MWIILVHSSDVSRDMTSACTSPQQYVARDLPQIFYTAGLLPSRNRCSPLTDHGYLQAKQAQDQSLQLLKVWASLGLHIHVSDKHHMALYEIVDQQADAWREDQLILGSFRLAHLEHLLPSSWGKPWHLNPDHMRGHLHLHS